MRIYTNIIKVVFYTVIIAFFAAILIAGGMLQGQYIATAVGLVVASTLFVILRGNSMVVRNGVLHYWTRTVFQKKATLQLHQIESVDIDLVAHESPFRISRPTRLIYFHTKEDPVVIDSTKFSTRAVSRLVTHIGREFPSLVFSENAQQLAAEPGRSYASPEKRQKYTKEFWHKTLPSREFLKHVLAIIIIALLLNSKPILSGLHRLLVSLGAI